MLAAFSSAVRSATSASRSIFSNSTALSVCTKRSSSCHAATPSQTASAYGAAGSEVIAAQIALDQTLPSLCRLRVNGKRQQRGDRCDK